MIYVKPRIRYIPVAQVWRCGYSNYMGTYGLTPLDAYNNWIDEAHKNHNAFGMNSVIAPAGVVWWPDPIMPVDVTAERNLRVGMALAVAAAIPPEYWTSGCGAPPNIRNYDVADIHTLGGKYYTPADDEDEESSYLDERTDYLNGFKPNG